MHGTIRHFLGSRDINQVALYCVFPSSPISVISPVEIEDRWPVVLEGPEFQLRFLHKYLLKMVKESPLADTEGSWIGVHQKSAERIELFYQYGSSDKDRIELLVSKFRYDIVRYGNLMLAHVSVIEVVCDEQTVFYDYVALPKKLINGSIKLPLIIIN